MGATRFLAIYVAKDGVVLREGRSTTMRVNVMMIVNITCGASDADTVARKQHQHLWMVINVVQAQGLEISGKTC